VVKTGKSCEGIVAVEDEKLKRGAVLEVRFSGKGKADGW
jgi:hypothetical protein